MTHFCTLRTFPLEEAETREGGQFEMPVSIDHRQMAKSGDPRGFVNNEIAVHLAQAIIDTEAPKELWYAEFSDFAQRAFNFPQIVRFG